jgi:hypothetical protein
MNKVLDLRLVQAAKLAQEQQVAQNATRMIALQESRERLVGGVHKDMSSLMALCVPWKYVGPTG